MSNVIILPVVTCLDIDPARVLQAALDRGMKEVVVIGVASDGEEYLASSSDAASAVYHTRRAEHRLMRIIDQD